MKLAFHHTLYEWIPYFKEFTLSWDLGQADARFDNRVDSYSYHCGMAPMLLWDSGHPPGRLRLCAVPRK